MTPGVKKKIWQNDYDGINAERLTRVAQESGESPRLGRAPATSQREISRAAIELFLERGFEETFVDDIAQAAGISRRTFFRYFPSKNDLPWGEFDELIDALRQRLAGADPKLSIETAVRQAIIDVNNYPEDERVYHRHRMGLLLTVPSLAAHSTLRYAAWRQVVAEFVADLRGERVARRLEPGHDRVDDIHRMHRAPQHPADRRHPGVPDAARHDLRIRRQIVAAVEREAVAGDARRHPDADGPELGVDSGDARPDAGAALDPVGLDP
ncbi:MAG: TetR family transcriptional regulator, partial [Actinobacteria bacterium]|nr:TetR family transcriptional regulator [Actinomycetota bacterium]